MIKPDWNKFKAKFSENPQSNFEWFCYLLFCKEFNKSFGLFRYKNQSGIETSPIIKGKEVVGWQAKFYETTLSDHKDDLLGTITKSKKDYPNLTKIIFYTNQEWGQGKGQNDPKAKVAAEQKAKEFKIEIEWRTASFFESPFVTVNNEEIAQHFFNLDGISNDPEKTLSVKFYTDDLGFSDRINAFKVDVFDKEIKDVFSKRILHLIEEIKAIKLGPFSKDVKSFNRVELKDLEKKNYIDKIKKYFNQDIDNTFFYLGDLYFIPDYYEGNPKVGSAEEKRKNDLLDEFFTQLNVYEKMFDIDKFLSNYYCVPLVLKNDGLVSDKDIRVLVKIPEEVKVLTFHNIKLSNTDIIQYFESIIMLFNLYFRQNSNYIVSEHYWHEQNRVETIITNNHDNEDELLSKFAKFLEGFYDFKIFNGDGFKALEFKFSNSLNAGENIAFKSFLLVHSSESFELQYELTSLHLGGKLTRNLNYDIPSSLPFKDSCLTDLDIPFGIDDADPFGIDDADLFGIDDADPFRIDDADIEEFVKWIDEKNQSSNK